MRYICRRFLMALMDILGTSCEVKSHPQQTKAACVHDFAFYYLARIA